jgi:hypothetical protein
MAKVPWLDFHGHRPKVRGTKLQTSGGKKLQMDSANRSLAQGDVYNGLLLPRLWLSDPEHLPYTRTRSEYLINTAPIFIDSPKTLSAQTIHCVSRPALSLFPWTLEGFVARGGTP